MRETAFQTECLRLAKRLGLLAVNIHGSGWSNKGFPDLLVFHAGRVVAVELKGDSGYKVQPDQIVWRNRFLRQGIPHHVIDSIELFEETMREEFDL
ncbi:MAG: VRR-NUC domain-containing protein [Atopobiaceae bacterium]|nr:VRR-NUC domain-containing protein [Atopobiaceae bacterium]